MDRNVTELETLVHLVFIILLVVVKVGEKFQSCTTRRLKNGSRVSTCPSNEKPFPGHLTKEDEESSCHGRSKKDKGPSFSVNTFGRLAVRGSEVCGSIKHSV